MKGIRGLRFGLLGAAAIAVVLLGGVILSSQALAQTNAVSISSGEAEPGESGDVVLEALGIADPGLGAWTLDISYDTDVISVEDCAPEQGGVCNPEFGDGLIRVTGASASGLEGDTLLGTITFDCEDAEGSSALTIAVEVFADATIGDPQDTDPTVSNGTFDCEEATVAPTVLPPTGTGFASDGSGSSVSWLIALFAALGAVGLAAGYGVLRLRTR